MGRPCRDAVMVRPVGRRSRGSGWGVDGGWGRLLAAKRRKKEAKKGEGQGGGGIGKGGERWGGRWRWDEGFYGRAQRVPTIWRGAWGGREPLCGSVISGLSLRRRSKRVCRPWGLRQRKGVKRRLGKGQKLVVYYGNYCKLRCFISRCCAFTPIFPAFSRVPPCC